MEYNKKKVTEIYMEELNLSLTEAINADPPLSVDEIIEMIQQKRKEQELPETEVIQVGLSTLTSHYSWSNLSSREDCLRRTVD